MVNGIVALLATGGSTNHTMHLVAMARAAGILINWDDFSDLSEVVPLMARLYPNGPADINHFRAAGGVPVLMRELLNAGLLHEDVNTVAGFGLKRYTLEPRSTTASWTGVKARKGHWITMSLPLLISRSLLTAVLRC